MLGWMRGMPVCDNSLSPPVMQQHPSELIQELKLQEDVDTKSYISWTKMQ